MFLITAAEIQTALATGSAIMAVIDYLQCNAAKWWQSSRKQLSLFVL